MLSSFSHHNVSKKGERYDQSVRAGDQHKQRNLQETSQQNRHKQDGSE